ncbi:MAG: hypothetical protein JWR88_249 [Pseudonocardia sp.]|jgi:predicted small metal-binding protein|nr:hypothetical protein [Pseudonocardia sp.]
MAKEFQCDSPECSSHFTAADTEEMRREIAKHLRDVHDIDTPTQTIMNYLETTSVKETSGRAAG